LVATVDPSEPGQWRTAFPVLEDIRLT
jgi:hypothetical protein